MRLNELRCTECGNDEVIAVWPGQQGVQGDLFTVLRDRPVKIWCELCWLKRFGPKPRQPKGAVRVRLRATV